MSYNPLAYWTENGKNKVEYHGKEYDHQQKYLLQYLSDTEFESVLELGCGYGRYTKLLFENFGHRIKHYAAIDISYEQLRKLWNSVRDERLVLVHKDITSMPRQYFHESFDLVFSVDFLMHIMPDKIEQIISNALNWTRKHFINLDYCNLSREKVELADHNFEHDYSKIYKRHPHKTINTVSLLGINEIIYHLEKRHV